MHKSVLLQEAIDLIAPKTGGIYVDATVGAGGHLKEIASRIGKAGVLIAMDKDERALETARKVLAGSGTIFIHADFKNIAEAVQKAGYSKVDGIIADLGVSSMQLDEGERGFSFSRHAKLDMRMDESQELTAYDVVNTYSEGELTDIFRKYGEEPKARKIAQKIVQERENGPFIWTDQLAEAVRGVMRTQGVRPKKIDPATKVFQALRIEVNKELTALLSALPQMVSLLKKGGRLVVISFHSLEDRIVKDYLREMSKDCICPPESPKCVCDAKAKVKVLTKKPITPKDEEIKANPRSRSAKMRAAEKI